MGEQTTVPFTRRHEVDGNAIRRLLEQVRPAMSTDDTRPVDGLELVLADSGAMAWATDGHRIHVATLGGGLDLIDREDPTEIALRVRSVEVARLIGAITPLQGRTDVTVGERRFAEVLGPGQEKCIVRTLRAVHVKKGGETGAEYDGAGFIEERDRARKIQIGRVTPQWNASVTADVTTSPKALLDGLKAAKDYQPKSAFNGPTDHSEHVRFEVLPGGVVQLRAFDYGAEAPIAWAGTWASRFELPRPRTFAFHRDYVTAAVAAAKRGGAKNVRLRFFDELDPMVVCTQVAPDATGYGHAGVVFMGTVMPVRL